MFLQDLNNCNFPSEAYQEFIFLKSSPADPHVAPGMLQAIPCFWLVVLRKSYIKPWLSPWLVVHASLPECQLVLRRTECCKERQCVKLPSAKQLEISTVLLGGPLSLFLPTHSRTLHPSGYTVTKHNCERMRKKRAQFLGCFLNFYFERIIDLKEMQWQFRRWRLPCCP